jgi:hypothetical protein
MPPWQVTILVVLFSIVAGFLLTSPGIISWDDVYRYSNSRWLLSQYRLTEFTGPITRGTEKYYSILLELPLGIFTEYVFSFLYDPYWVRHALHFALYPLSLFLTFYLLRTAGVSRGSSFLAVAALFGIIRLGGHALVNLKDFQYAAGYWLVTLAMWVLLRAFHQRVAARKATMLLILCLGALSVVPFLLHFPDISHFLILIAFLSVYAVFAPKRWSFVQRLALPLAALMVGCVVVFILYPPMWQEGMLSVWGRLLDRSLDWGLTENVRFFGWEYSSTRLPWWYAFVWLPVMANPAVFLFVVVGFFLSFFSPRPLGHAFLVRVGKWNIHLSLRRWLWLFVMVTWGAVAILQPQQFGEERHILFLYPLLFLFGALGWDALRERPKYVIASILMVASLSSYVYWGKYSYVYESPLIGRINPHAFTDEYLAVCLGDGVKALKGRVPSGYTVAAFYGLPLVRAHDERLRNGFISQDPEYGTYTFVQDKPTTRPFAALSYNHFGIYGGVMDDIRNGKAKLLWQAVMPPHNPACVLALYP